MGNIKCKGRVRRQMPEFALYLRENAGNSDETMARLKAALPIAMREDLTKRQREVVELYYMEGLTIRQVGEILAIDYTTVSRTLDRAERNLRNALKFLLITPE